MYVKILNRENEKRAYNHGYFLINKERLAEGCVQCIHIWSREGVVTLDYTPLAVSNNKIMYEKSYESRNCNQCPFLVLSRKHQKIIINVFRFLQVVGF